MKVFTIGFAKKSAEQFFTKLQQPGLVRLLDVRLKNASQLAGFTKRDDLRYFLRNILGIEYRHLPELAPTKDLFDAYKKKHIDWAIYERRFLNLMVDRRIETVIPKPLIDGGCFLCSETSPQNCHRRLLAEYLRRCWGELEIEHL